MAQYQDLRNTLLVLAGNENAIVVHKAFVEFTGSLEAGIMLGQLLYWTPRAKRGDGFIAKSYDEWSDELCLTQYAVRKARKVLEDMGVLETKLKKWNGAPTVHYRLDQDELDRKWICWIRQMETANSTNGNGEPNESITETTTETTTEKEHDGKAKEPEPKERKLTPHQQMFGRLAELCQIDLEKLTKTDQGKLNKVSQKLLKTGEGIEDIDVFERYWFARDWRGKQGQPPGPWDVVKEWGRMEHWVEQGQPMNSRGREDRKPSFVDDRTPQEMEALREQMRARQGA